MYMATVDRHPDPRWASTWALTPPHPTSGSRLSPLPPPLPAMAQSEGHRLPPLSRAISNLPQSPPLPRPSSNYSRGYEDSREPYGSHNRTQQSLQGHTPAADNLQHQLHRRQDQAEPSLSGQHNRARPMDRNVAVEPPIHPVLALPHLQDSMLARSTPQHMSGHDNSSNDGYASSPATNIQSVVDQLTKALLTLELEVHDSLTGGTVPVNSPPSAEREGTLDTLVWALETVRRTTDNIKQWKRWDPQPSFTNDDSSRRKRFADFELTGGVTKRTRVEGSSATPEMPNGPTGRDPHMPHKLPSPGSNSYSSALAHAAHLQGLQASINNDSAALDALRHERDSLVSKLERERKKSHAWEKKFEMTDAEIQQLADEKDRLQGQISALEEQIREAHKSRDEARTQSIANGGQYLKIIQMANQLQEQGADERKQWATDKRTLEQEVKFLADRIKDQDLSSSESRPEASAAHRANESSKNQCPSLEELAGQDGEDGPFASFVSSKLARAHADGIASILSNSTLPKDELEQLRGIISTLDVAVRDIRENSVLVDKASSAARQRFMQLITKVHQIEGSLPGQ